METAAPASDLERRKKVRMRLRADLGISSHRYEGRSYFIVKDPITLRYYRFKEQEHYLLQLMDGEHTLDDAQKEFEKRFRPERLTLEDLEGFAQQLLKAGLIHNESPQAGKQLFKRRRERTRHEWLATLTNILYIKIPVFDPDRVLTKMLVWTRWIFTTWFFVLSVGVMAAALLLVLTHFQTFRDKLPYYQEFFSFKTAFHLWIALGVVKIIHEFGHGLSCKAFGGEVHEIGALFLCLSPCLYCNVSDSWTLPNKWHRMIISFAGIYVELMIAAIATFVWWNTPSYPYLNNLCLCLMVVCSISTVVFNGNPLMRYDGYYILFDWLEIPNLRDRSNQFLKRLVMIYCLGIELPPDQYMAPWRRWLFVSYAITSYIYRWVVTYYILWFFAIFLTPHKLGSIGAILTISAIASMLGWPAYRLIMGIHKRGRLPDMKSVRVTITLSVLAAIVLFILLLPLPVSRVRQAGLVQMQPDAMEKVVVPAPGGILTALHVRDGQHVQEGELLAEFRNLDLENQLEDVRSEYDIRVSQWGGLHDQWLRATDTRDRARLEVLRAAVAGERDTYAGKRDSYEAAIRRIRELRAPRSGMVIHPPRLDEVGKFWEKGQDTPFCGIGDPGHLRVLVPVAPPDYRLIREDLESARKRGSTLAVTIRVTGRGGSTWKGRLATLPESEAKEVPYPLTSRGGGPLAVRQNLNVHTYKPEYVPLSQHYLVPIDFVDSDNAICPGTLAQVKIHCQWRTCGWWLWRTISAAFDLGLM